MLERPSDLRGKKIVILIGSFIRGGAQRQAYLLVREMRERYGLDAEVWALKHWLETHSEHQSEIARRARAMINEAFAKESDPARRVVTPYIAPDCTSVYAQYTIEVADRAKVEQGMKARGIPTAVHYPVPLHLQPVFANLGHGVGSFPKSEAAGHRVLSLPMHPYLSEAHQVQVVQALKESVLG